MTCRHKSVTQVTTMRTRLMTKLHLRFLGPFTAEIATQPLPRFQTLKMQALLAYLVFHADRPVRRDELAGLFWPELPQKVARHNLRQSLYRLRQAVNQIAPNFSGQLLTVSQQTVQVNQTAIDHDTAVFNTPPQTVVDLETAVALYRGEFLAGITMPENEAFTAWLDFQRQKYHQQVLDYLSRVIQSAQTDQTPIILEQYAQQLLQLEPWHEQTHQQLMRLYQAQGDTEKALAQFEQCRAVLHRERGVTPSVETQTLYDAIQTDQAILYSGFAGERESEKSPLVGRTSEIAQGIEQLAQPTCRWLTLHGPGGVGKTRLAQAITQQLGRSQLPHINQIIFVPLASAPDGQAFESALMEGVGIHATRENRATRMQLLSHLCTIHCLLVLDNMEYLHQECDFLIELLTLSPHSKLLLTSRDPFNHPLEQRMQVAGLGPTEAVELFRQSVAQQTADFSWDETQEAMAVEICTLVQGMPLAIELSAAWGAEKETWQQITAVSHNLHTFATDNPAVLARHRSVEAVFTQSWQQLSRRDQAVLASLAIFSGRFSWEAARNVAQATLGSIATLVDRSLIYRAGERYTVHELLRQFAEAKLAESGARDAAEQAHARFYFEQLSQLPARLAAVPARVSPQTILADLPNIRHAWEWGVAKEDYALLRTGVSGLVLIYERVGHFDDVQQLIGHALIQFTADTADVLIEDKAKLLCDLYTYHAHVLQRRGLYDIALGEVESGLALARAHQNYHYETELLISQASVWELQGKYSDAVECLLQICDLPDVYNTPSKLARILHHLGSLFRRKGELPKSLGFFQDALAIHDQLEEPEIDKHVDILRDMAIVAMELGRYTEALQWHQQALKIARASGHRENIARQLNNIGLIYWRMEALDDALENYSQALVLARELDIPRGVALCLGNIGVIQKRKNRFDQALVCYEQALAIEQKLGHADGQALCWGNIGNVHHLLGRDQEALRCYLQAIRLNEESGNQKGLAHHRLNLGTVYQDQFDFTAALREYNQAIQILRQNQEPYYLSSTLILKATLLFDQRSWGTAAKLAEEAEKIATGIQRTEVIFLAQLLKAKLAFQAGEADLARHCLAVLGVRDNQAEQAQLLYTKWELWRQEEDRQLAEQSHVKLIGYTPSTRYRAQYQRLKAGVKPLVISSSP